MSRVGVTTFFLSLSLESLKRVPFLSIDDFPGLPASPIAGLPVEERDLLQIQGHTETWVK